MILTLIGLILNFIGSFMLVYESITGLGKLKSVYLQGIGMNGKILKYDYEKDNFLKRVKYTKEEIKLTIALGILSFGFVLQLLDFV